jgi:Alpha amylase, catalytic domain
VSKRTKSAAAVSEAATIAGVRYPSLYQINTRVWLTDLARRLGRPVTLDDIPDEELDRLADLGFDWIWMLSVWQTGPAGRRVSRSNPEWLAEYHHTLPDLQEDDIAGSGFAITGYTVDPSLGGEAALARLRTRLQSRGRRLMLDFVPNHMGLDHHWVESHPEYFIAGTEADLEREPQNYTRVGGPGGQRIFAYGRDPYCGGWPDTLQLDYSNPATQRAMSGELARIAGRCDGVRCDMAMLVLPDVFERTWGRRPEPFWSRVIPQVRDKVQGFCFMAEVYWDLEWTMQQEGFDYAYDKRLYDRLRDGHARPVREHLQAEPEYQNGLARFLENHDEPRAAATFSREMHEAAAVITFLSPGLRFFHQGQFEGRQKRVSPHLVRAPQEPRDEEVQGFYDRLLSVLRSAAVRQGQWQQLECMPAWDGNWTHEGFLAYAWQGADAERLLVTVNYAPNQGQCRVRLPFADVSGHAIRLDDVMSGAHYDREGSDVVSNGLYVDLPPWGYHVFEVTTTTASVAPSGGNAAGVITGGAGTGPLVS